MSKEQECAIRQVRLTRVSAGLYKTADDRFQIQRDPTGGDQNLGWGYSSWIMCDTKLSDDYGPHQYGKLRDVRNEISRILQREG